MVGGGWPRGAYLTQVLLADGPHALPLRVELLLALLLVQLLALGLLSARVRPAILAILRRDISRRSQHLGLHVLGCTWVLLSPPPRVAIRLFVAEVVCLQGLGRRSHAGNAMPNIADGVAEAAEKRLLRRRLEPVAAYHGPARAHAVGVHTVRAAGTRDHRSRKDAPGLLLRRLRGRFRHVPGAATNSPQTKPRLFLCVTYTKMHDAGKISPHARTGK